MINPTRATKVGALILTAILVWPTNGRADVDWEKFGKAMQNMQNDPLFQNQGTSFDQFSNSNSKPTMVDIPCRNKCLKEGSNMMFCTKQCSY
jgi:hypothetical protein